MSTEAKVSAELLPSLSTYWKYTTGTYFELLTTITRSMNSFFFFCVTLYCISLRLAPSSTSHVHIQLSIPSRGHKCKKEIIYGQGPEENIRFGAVTNANKKKSSKM